MKLKIMEECSVSRYEIKNKYQFESSVDIRVKNMTQIDFLRKGEMKGSS